MAEKPQDYPSAAADKVRYWMQEGMPPEMMTGAGGNLPMVPPPGLGGM
jgi:hypothetical protein